MPAIARKLLIFAGVDGLILQPLHTHKSAERRERSGAVKLSYKTASISSTPTVSLPVDDSTNPIGFEAFGIVGLLTVSTSSFLISITKREQVAQIHGKPIYVVTEVAITPLSSFKDASKSIDDTAWSLRQRADEVASETESDTDQDEDEATVVIDDVEDVQEDEAKDKTPSHGRSSSVVEDVIRNKGGYGRFAQKWFSQNGWAADRKRELGLSGSESPDVGPKRDIIGDIPERTLDAEIVVKAPRPDSAETMIPKLLRTTSLLFGSSRSFFFSYDHDLTRSYTDRRQAGHDMSLYKEVDPLYFWNRNVSKPFIEAGQDSMVLPLVQGFVGQREFVVERYPETEAGKDELEMTDFTETRAPSETRKSPPNADGFTDGHEGSLPAMTTPPKPEFTRTYLLTLISRRSIKRAGLRYLRRGVDSDGNTANSVETEQILSAPDWAPTHPSYSFLQIRGSIPLFFSQSPYSFKPVPQMQQSTASNFEAFQRHFTALTGRYGKVQVTSLVEKHDPERDIGEAFENNMTQLNAAGGVNGTKVEFEWFDFHAMCRGMKFENVSLLIETLGPILDEFGYNIEQDFKMSKKQSGVLRTNCMDCLDRTNVVQSACGRRALEVQLKAERIDLSAQKDQTTQWFNTLWADNGDAISKQYASTAALKGDFTRTRKRNYKGALTDMGLSISRYYSGIVNDYFSQTAIDFLVGNVTSQAFEDYSTTLTPLDPSISTAHMRQRAIDVSSRLVIEDSSEELHSGYTLLTPRASNTIKSMPFEEAVLLITDKALYSCRFDFNTEKVSSFERVDLSHVSSVKYGTYIISTLSPAQTDEETNFGLVVSYKAGEHDIQRVNTRSMSSINDCKLHEATSPVKAGPAADEKVIALKAPQVRSAIASDNMPDTGKKMSERQQVEMICREVERLVRAARLAEGESKEKCEELFVVGGDIIGLAEAKRSTGLLEQLGHSLKKLVWA